MSPIKIFAGCTLNIRKPNKAPIIPAIAGVISEYNLSTSELEKLDEKLKNIKIVDPACGSGAFLNKAADVLLEIHEHYHAARYANSKNKLDQWFDSVNSRREILINNIYGVDLNPESVEITKLALFSPNVNIYYLPDEHSRHLPQREQQEFAQNRRREY